MKKRGFTLYEMLVYIAVLSVFTTALYAVFNLTARHFRLSEAKSDSLQSGLKAVTFINRALTGGANNTLQVQNNPSALMFLSAEPPGQASFAVNAAGDLLWQKWVCFYHDSQNRRLMSTQQYITPTPTIPAAPPFATMLALPARVVARDISTFDLTLVDTKTVSYAITTAVKPQTTSSLVGQDNRIGVRTQGTFTLRN